VTGAVGVLHDKLVFDRRARTLASLLAALIPPHARILDVGCGDGMIDTLIGQQMPGVSIEGIDALVWPSARIPVRKFDGARIPCEDGTFDMVMFVDVLHHTHDPVALLREAKRVGKTVLVKDHFRQGFAAGLTLRFMDWVGNAHHGVALPYNYWSPTQWSAAFDEVGLRAVKTIRALGLYPWPANWVFERRLHFIGLWEPRTLHKSC
jgi:SAM-dependent methyltransferase